MRQLYPSLYYVCVARKQWQHAAAIRGCSEDVVRREEDDAYRAAISEILGLVQAIPITPVPDPAPISSYQINRPPRPKTPVLKVVSSQPEPIRQSPPVESSRRPSLVLEEALGVGLKTLERFPADWCLTGKEARVFGVLMKRDVASKLAILAACYTVIDKEPEIKIIDVFICKIRAKLKPFGLTIETQWGSGYYLTPAMKAMAREMMKAEAGSDAEASA